MANDLRTVNQIAAALRVFQAIRATGGRFMEADGEWVDVRYMDHFEDTDQLNDGEIEALIDSLYAAVPSKEAAQ